jgi:amino acid adenylation domain-containing protein/non-ribosomal peptide synthase protein (TIGR01720 family)
VGPEVRVGICLERSPEMVIGLLGILKAGGAFVPLDPTHPAERLSYMLEDSKTSVLLTQVGLQSRLSRKNQVTMCLDTHWEMISREPQTGLANNATTDNLAYIYYTSGSTGKPKGVVIAHRGIVNYVRWAVKAYSVVEGNGAPFHTSIAVDLTLTNLLPLFVGRSIALVSAISGIDGLIDSIMNKPGWSILKLTPTHLKLLNTQLAAIEIASCARSLVIGGDNLLAEHIVALCDQIPEVSIINEYGPTETVVGCCTYTATRASLHNRSVPIGRPIANTRLYVLDRYFEPVPTGVPGELYIGGAGLARGYFERQDLTAEYFVPDPFSGLNGERLYRTGDQVRHLPDGNLEYLGRLDHQVKIRGFRIELGEVEAALNSYSGIESTLADVREDVPGDKRLVAYLVTKVPINHADLRRHLKERLPEYMIPSAFVSIDELPIAPSGKLDRKRLSRPEITMDEEKYIAPRTDVENLLCEIWGGVLGAAQISIHDNFFELGGDSILCIQVVTRAREAGVHLTVRQMFEHQTIAELSTVAINDFQGMHAEQAMITGGVPLTPIQKAFFQWGLISPEYFNHAVLLELNTGMNTRLLEEAVAQLLIQHDGLRMKYETTTDGWRQWCEESVQTKYERIDLSGLGESEQSAELERHATSAQSTLNMQEPRLVKAIEYDLGGERGKRLLLVIHHLLVDGVSWRILLEDLEKGYEQLRKGGPLQLGPKTTSYKSWAEHLETYSMEKELERELEYWCGREFQGIQPLLLDHKVSVDGANLYGTQKTVTMFLGKDETRALLRDSSGPDRGHVNAVLLTALARTCIEWCGGDAALINIEWHGREELFPGVDVSHTVGWFTNIFPLLLSFKEKSWEPLSWLLAVKECLKAVPNNGAGYGILRYLTQKEAIRTRMEELPQPEISFNYLGQFDQVFRGSKLFKPARERGGRTIAAENRRQHILDVQGVVIENKLQISWSYSEELHQRNTLEGIAVRYMDSLRELIACRLDDDTDGYSPSDFPLTKITQKDLMKVAALLGEQ